MAYQKVPTKIETCNLWVFNVYSKGYNQFPRLGSFSNFYLKGNMLFISFSFLTQIDRLGLKPKIFTC